MKKKEFEFEKRENAGEYLHQPGKSNFSHFKSVMYNLKDDYEHVRLITRSYLNIGSVPSNFMS